jgi:hypothetical protein
LIESFVSVTIHAILWAARRIGIFFVPLAAIMKMVINQSLEGKGFWLRIATI